METADLKQELEMSEVGEGLVEDACAALVTQDGNWSLSDKESGGVELPEPMKVAKMLELGSGVQTRLEL